MIAREESGEGDGPGVGHALEVQHAGPRDVGGLPARADVVQAVRVGEVGSIDGELAVCVEFGFYCVCACPWVGRGGFENEHAVV